MGRGLANVERAYRVTIMQCCYSCQVWCRWLGSASCDVCKLLRRLASLDADSSLGVGLKQKHGAKTFGPIDSVFANAGVGEMGKYLEDAVTSNGDPAVRSLRNCPYMGLTLLSRLETKLLDHQRQFDWSSLQCVADSLWERRKSITDKFDVVRLDVQLSNLLCSIYARILPVKNQSCLLGKIRFHRHVYLLNCY